jgi:ubiquinone/menaquinone biosynthesis C-methylase UbiE
MVHRRTVLGAGTAATIGATMAAQAATTANKAPTAKSNSSPPGTLAPRGRFERMERLPSVDLESRQDFLLSFRAWANRELSQAANKRAEAILQAKGVDAKADLPLTAVVKELEHDPLLQTSTRAWISCQQLSWNGLREEFEGHAPKYLAEMSAVDHSGPGSLELNPDLVLPDYTRHEIHIQPGGYVGNAFAGHLYHYGTNGFYSGRNFNDELHRGAANKLPLPRDGQVRRILDIGTGVGQLAMALKERFPDAQVWGIDAAAPMVRYAHLRGVERNLAVNFAQRLAEDSKFPDDYFDLVTSYIMFHEVSPAGTHAIVKEMHRIVRPGGIFYPIDFRLTNAPRRTPYQRYRLWWDHRWNNEVWSLKYRETGLPDIIRNAGFSLDEQAPEVLAGFGILNAHKPAPGSAWRHATRGSA